VNLGVYFLQVIEGKVQRKSSNRLRVACGVSVGVAEKAALCTAHGGKWKRGAQRKNQITNVKSWQGKKIGRALDRRPL